MIGHLPARPDWRDRLFLAFVAVLPLHTVFFSAWISWKPFLVILVVLAGVDVVDGLRERRFPWNRRVSAPLAIFGAAVLLGFPASDFRERYFQLGLALAVGGLVMLVSERRLRSADLFDRALRVVFWSAAAMGLTAVVFSVVTVGGFGPEVIDGVNRLPGIYRVSKPAYLTSGFLALTNWHQDPGYSAAWSSLWAAIAVFASGRGRGSGRWWLDGVVVGTLGFSVLMAFSRTGWVAFPIAVGFAAYLAVRREDAMRRTVLRLLAVAALSTAVILAGVWALDREDVGGDLDLQFSFRLSQGWDLLADLTGLFSSTNPFADQFDTSEERADVWPEYVAMFRENPVTGVGLGVGWETTSITQEPHNLALELLAETGLLGTGAFLLLLLTVVRVGRGPVGAVALVAAFLPSMTQTVLFEPTWWFAAGLYLAGRTQINSPGEAS